MKLYRVIWDQWYYTRYGKDYETVSMDFDSMAGAENFIEKIVTGDCLGPNDCTVHRFHISIKIVEEVY